MLLLKSSQFSPLLPPPPRKRPRDARGVHHSLFTGPQNVRVITATPSSAASLKGAALSVPLPHSRGHIPPHTATAALHVAHTIFAQKICIRAKSLCTYCKSVVNKEPYFSNNCHSHFGILVMEMPRVVCTTIIRRHSCRDLVAIPLYCRRRYLDIHDDQVVWL